MTAFVFLKVISWIVTLQVFRIVSRKSLLLTCTIDVKVSVILKWLKNRLLISLIIGFVIIWFLVPDKGTDIFFPLHVSYRKRPVIKSRCSALTEYTFGKGFFFSNSYVIHFVWALFIGCIFLWAFDLRGFFMNRYLVN